eukprot:TRINITY_DN34714_c0_g1_i1.p4 TRINITY_DN34714_c0_g1~~TRINITY_DN34714_c0_g1_i1.p4  ORF type:complete len:114 (+),score=30.68 TRINITY_DN34714_c0_g1_i1:38-343(+)
MKNALTITAVALLTATGLAADGTIEITARPNAIDEGGQLGGEFQVTITDVQADLAALGYGIGDVFETFCLELDEPIAVGASSDVEINDAAKAFGGGTKKKQ